MSSQGQVVLAEVLGTVRSVLPKLHGGSFNDFSCTETTGFYCGSFFSCDKNEKLNEEESLVSNDIDVEKVQQTVRIVEVNLRC